MVKNEHTKQDTASTKNLTKFQSRVLLFDFVIGLESRLPQFLHVLHTSSRNNHVRTVGVSHSSQVKVTSENCSKV